MKYKKPKKVLVTGAQGQLGADMMELLKRKGITAVGYGKDQLDITNAEQVLEVIGYERPTHVVHAAAFTKVDEAEGERDKAYAINAFGTRNVAVAANKVGARLVYVSTDYVFDGRATTPYHEFARPRPMNVYGATKYEGENFVRNHHARAFIVRTSWVFGVHGPNFAKMILQLGHQQPELKVVHDQVGSPTYTVDLAEMILQLMVTERYGTYHVSNSGTCSWYEFACAIMEEAGLAVKVRPVPTSQFPRPARRPAFSALEGMALRLNGFPALRPWQEALRDFIARLPKD
ncbi:dTDP-4-dehydrorhamnose reductase [Paenibacillus sp. 481]|uniref:dTDP-4-dehydrorhamnose reductase n=1 Tax=Paenibacillus sp. 481 TaxID=2835869 RepID=UPI001E6336E6|nr:dTDP-4-dehydrorhamnose reductase [Paenibacillus sp. 481]UHA71973.1 dTDP-4-dehydrorhamnose reductase [Paenibacillus sp. 481]